MWLNRAHQCEIPSFFGSAVYFEETKCVGEAGEQETNAHTVCFSRTLANHIVSGPRRWNFPLRSVWSTCTCMPVYTHRREQDLSESEKDLWHNSSAGYSLVVSVWSCVCVWQYDDILDQFSLTQVSGTLRLMFRHRDCEDRFLIWLLAAQFSYQAIPYA